MKIEIKRTESFMTCMDFKVEAFWTVRILHKTFEVAKYYVPATKTRGWVMEGAKDVKWAFLNSGAVYD